MEYSQVKQCIEELDRSGFEDLLKNLSEEIIIAGLECDIPPSDIEEAFQGAYKDRGDFAQEMAESLGSINKELTWPYTCIDWDYAGKELMYDYCEDNGYYFRMF